MAIRHGDIVRNAMCQAVIDMIDQGSGNGKLIIIDEANVGPNGGVYVSGNDLADADPAGAAAVATPVGGAGQTRWSQSIAELEFIGPDVAGEGSAFKAAGESSTGEGGTVIKGGRCGTAHANSVADYTECRTGTATHFEIVDGDGNLILNGKITIQSDSSGDIRLTSSDINQDDTISIRNLSYTCAP